LYDTFEEVLDNDGRVETYSIITGKWNSVSADKSHRNIFGQHGLSRRNQRGQMSIDCCKGNGLLITSTWFEKPKRIFYIRKETEDRNQHELDYIHVTCRFRSRVTEVQTLPNGLRIMTKTIKTMYETREWP